VKTSPAGIFAIRGREGCVLHAYQDSVGVWTIGVGHTGRMAPPLVHPGMIINTAQADQFLAVDLAPTEAALNAVIKVPVTANEFDALASITFNIGIGGMRGSSFMRQLNLRNYRACADDFLLWDRPAVLLRRRREERAQFLTPDRSPT
jgi:lysozyme